jgi:CRP-like cAMP-binding protein
MRTATPSPQVQERDLFDDHDLAARLGAVALFDGLPSVELAALAEVCTMSSARPRQHLEVQDAPVQYWQVIISGHAVVQRDGIALGLLGEGDSWSEHSLLNQQRSPISVIALSPVIVLAFSERAFTGRLMTHPALGPRLRTLSASSADRLALPVFRALTHMERADFHRVVSR